MSILYILNNKEILDLFEIKLSDFEGYFRFHGSKNLDKNVIFKGNEYLYIPCEISNLEYNSDGKQSRPTFSVSNLNNYFTNLIKDRNNLIGKRIYRKKIFAKDLDDINFGSDATRNPLRTAGFSDFVHIDTFVINKKNSENRDKIEFTLSNILDIDGLTAPRRKIYSDYCNWQYRGYGCNYGKLQNYSGPTIQIPTIQTNESTTLKEITDELGVSNNLVVWLRPEGLVFGGETSRDTFLVKYSPEYAGNDFFYTQAGVDDIIGSSFSLEGINSISAYEAWVSTTQNTSSPVKVPARATVYDSSENVWRPYIVNANLQLQYVVNTDRITNFTENEKFYKARDITNWTNDANIVNTSLSPSTVTLSATDKNAQTYAPQEYVNNTSRMNGINGAFFSANVDYFGFGKFGNASMTINYNFGGGTSPYTIIYVSENVNRLFNYERNFIVYDNQYITWEMGKIGSVLTSSTQDFRLGYSINEKSQKLADFSPKTSHQDTAKFLDTFSVNSNENAYDHLNTPVAYACSLGNYSNSELAIFTKNAITIKKQTLTTSASPSGPTLGINLKSDNDNPQLDESSECVIYEVLIFDTNLNESQMNSIHEYLAIKYDLPYNALLTTKTSKNSIDFFKEYGEDINLGIPIATENNKLFSLYENLLGNQFETFRITDLTYKGTYNSKEYYKRGDFVKIDPEINFDFNETIIKKNSEIPPRFFVCVNPNGAKDLHPFKFKNIWIEDKCSKTLNGCILRFGGEGGAGQIPFGGFPGTVTYEYKMPGAGQ